MINYFFHSVLLFHHYLAFSSESFPMETEKELFSFFEKCKHMRFSSKLPLMLRDLQMPEQNGLGSKQVSSG